MILGDVAQVTDASSFILTIQFYLVRCDPEGPVLARLMRVLSTPMRKLEQLQLKKDADVQNGGMVVLCNSTDETVTIKAGDGIGMFIKSNNDGQW